MNMPPVDACLDQANTLLRERFGFAEFQPGQRAVIQRLLAGQSAVAVLPTGGGKSLCYQLPALLLDGLTLVVSPLISLMKDQIDALTARGIAADRLDHSLGDAAWQNTLAAARQARIRLLYVSPERFSNERFRTALSGMTIALMAVDEAHCISEWGHNFRPDYLQLPNYARACRAQRVLALTATATPAVLQDIGKQFDIPAENQIRTGFYRSNLTLHFAPVTSEQRDAHLRELLRQQPAGPTIVYVTQQRTAETLATRLANDQFAARAYHAGLDPDERSRLQEWFLESTEAIMVATIAFGMGIDKANIRYVYHYNLPKSLESYAQEIGRAGRDGGTSTCWLLANSDDRTILENFVYGDSPSVAAVERLVQYLFSLPVEFQLSHYDLANQTDLRLLVLQTLLTYLQADGWIAAGTPYYSEYRFQLQHPSAKILAGYQGERREFLAAVFREARAARTWHYLDLDQAAKRIGSPRERIIRALDYLSTQGDLLVRAAAMRHRYRQLRQPDDRQGLSQSLAARMEQREASDLQRIQAVVDLIEHDGCQTARLSEYFGESLAQPCGHCSWCLNGHRRCVLPPRQEQTIEPSLLRAFRQLVSDHESLFASAKQRARFLCGLTSPALITAKLTKHSLFGSLAHVPFVQVIEQLDHHRSQA